jgi:hypothetical protein
MNNAEFQKRLAELFEHHHRLKNRKPTLNELVYVLRMDDIDYNISIPPYKEDMAWTCIPSVKKAFIPVETLALHVVEVEFDEEGTKENSDIFDGWCLDVTVEEKRNESNSM